LAVSRLALAIGLVLIASGASARNPAASEDTAPKAQKNPANLKAGKLAWAKVVKALGGDALKDIQAMRSTGNLTVNMGEQTVAFKHTTLVAFPDRARQVLATPAGDQTIILNAQEGFILFGEKVQPMPKEVFEDQKQEQNRNLFYLLRYSNEPGLEITAAGQEQVNGADCQTLAVSFKGLQFRLWVSPDGKVVKQSYPGAHPFTRAPGLIENYLSEYRPEGPLLIPHKMTRRFEGQDVVTVTVDAFDLNPKVEPEAFKKPAQ